MSLVSGTHLLSGLSGSSNEDSQKDHKNMMALFTNNLEIIARYIRDLLVIITINYAYYKRYLFWAYGITVPFTTKRVVY